MATSVLVTGATGNQGGSVVEHLLESETEFDVYGLTRDASGDRAQELADQGVTTVEGDLNDEESLRPHVAEADAVFTVTNFWTEGYDQQVQQGKNIADVAAEEGVDQFVFSGVGSHERDTGVPHFDSADEIDRYAQELDLPMTVLQPVFFFQNFEAFAEDVVEDGQIALPLEEGVFLQMIDVENVGRAAAVAFENPDEFVGERVELAGDELTLAETAEVLSEVTGRDVEPVHVPIEDAYDSFGEEFTVMCEWFNEVGYGADIDALEDRFGFEFTELERYLRENGWEDKEGMASVPGWVKAMQ
ncbi:NmrA family NAD(P)-binding protein [Natronorubrum sp. JWXQ-INN-674]|uniref:NmrA family NAD(P)-binding protein n=1 Tax=Natronorubrum halalkaliphilum TaxID=2691917 RepID=A0A6B0VLQ0_9EURY|nr:NmrA/HSCARG family protein [Natronorubrum halalkaliphilum]MXV62408.1 NmrA family NAD(P)-binding protein [Natronorubrum halalkaliphilum]